MAKSYRLDVPSDVAALNKRYTELERKLIPNAFNQATNEVMKKIKTKWVNLIAKKSGVAKKLITKRTTFLKATRRFTSAVIYIKTRAVELSEVGKLRRTKKSGIRVGRRHFPHGFVATMPGGRTGPYQRKGKDRLPIERINIEIETFIKRSERLYRIMAIKMFEPAFNRRMKEAIRKRFNK